MSKYKNQLIGLGIILVATLIFCFPALQGKEMVSHDIVSWKYMSEESRKLSHEQNSYAFWTNSQFGGLPSVSTYGNQSGNWFAKVQFEWIQEYIPRPLFSMLLAGVAFFILGCSLGISPWISLFGALAFEFSSYNPILTVAGHDTKLLTIGYCVSALAGFVYMLRNRLWLGFAIYTVSMGFMWTSGHYQIIYYFLIVLAVIGAYVLLRKTKQMGVQKIGMIALLMVVGMVIGILPTAQQVLMVKDHTKKTMRGGNTDLTLTTKKGEYKKTSGLDIEYAFRWSQGIGETFSLLVPNVHGPMDHSFYEEGETASKLQELGLDQRIASQLPTYWGDQPGISGSVYFGVLVIFLFIFGLFAIESEFKWWVFGLSFLFIFLSWGRHFSMLNDFLFNHLPMYNKFRTPSMALTIPQIFFPFLAMWALHAITREGANKERLLKALKTAGGLTLLLVLLGGILSSFWQDFNGEAIQEVKKQLTQAFSSNPSAVNDLLSAMRTDMKEAVFMDGLRGLLILLAGAGLIWFYLKGKLSSTIMVLVFLGLTTIELIVVDKRYFTEDIFMDKDDYQNEYFAPRTVDNQILADKELYFRVQDLSTNTYNDARPAFFHKTVGGYHPAKLQIYQELIDVQLSKQNSAVYNMLNTKYFILPGQQEGQQPQVMPNPNRCGNAWFVNQIQSVKSADEEMLALNAPSMFSNDTQAVGNFNPKTTAIVREERLNGINTRSFSIDSTASIQLKTYGLNDLDFESNNAHAGFAVFSDIYYDGGWTCTIDDKQAPIIRTNYVLRGVQIPAGKHKIHFNFTPHNADLGRNLGRAGSVLLLLLFAFGLWKGRDEKEAAVEGSL
jgi:hypothetical protein